MMAGRLFGIWMAVVLLFSAAAEADPAFNVVLNRIEAKLSIRNEAGGIARIHSGPNGRSVTIIFDDGSARLWDFRAGVQRTKLDSPRRLIAAFSDDAGTGIIAVAGDGAILAFDAVRGAEIARVGSHQNAFITAGSGDGRVIVAAGGRTARIFRPSGPGAWTATDAAHQAEIAAAALNFDGSLLATADTAGDIRIWNAKSGQPIRALHRSKAKFARLGFVRGGEAIFAMADDGYIGVWPVAGGPAILESRRLPARVSMLAVDLSGTKAATAHDGSISVHDLGSGRVLMQTPKMPGKVTGLTFDGEGNRLLSSGSDGKLRIWDIRENAELLYIAFTKNGWLAVDPQGRFDGSEEGIDDVSWRTGATDIPLDRFSRDFFEGGLVRARWTDPPGRSSAPPVTAPAGKTPPPPLVEIDDLPGGREAGRSFEIIVVATDKGGGIGPVRLYHNGKLVEDGALVGQQEASRGGKTLRATAFRVIPTPGPNTFKGVSTNSQGIEGHSQAVTRVFEGPTPAATVHILTVGISKYADPALNLDYSASDAVSIAAEFEKAAKTAYSRVVRNVLVDERATSTDIRRALARLKETSEQDVIIVYFAGHGLIANGEWLFLPHESRFLKSEAEYAGKGIAASELKDALVGAKAQRILLAIDACYSGASLEQFQAFQRGSFRGISRTAGITTMAAARANQVAVETADLGRGLFTNAVISGLAGKGRINVTRASDQDPVTAHALTKYVTRETRFRHSQKEKLEQGLSPDASATRRSQPVPESEYLQEAVGFAIGADFVIRK